MSLDPAAAQMAPQTAAAMASVSRDIAQQHAMALSGQIQQTRSALQRVCAGKDQLQQEMEQLAAGVLQQRQMHNPQLSLELVDETVTQAVQPLLPKVNAHTLQYLLILSPFSTCSHTSWSSAACLTTFAR